MNTYIDINLTREELLKIYTAMVIVAEKRYDLARINPNRGPSDKFQDLLNKILSHLI